LQGLFKSVLAADIMIAAQTATDAERFVAVGADRSRVAVMGNIKFDIEVPPDLIQKGQALRASQFAHRFVWVAGSTHEVEEQIVLDAQLEIREKLPGALLVMVPRHPQRFAVVREWLQSQGVSFVIRSAHAAVTATDLVLLVDTLGELQMFYAACDVAFVGGTLVPVGGHNLLEPAALSIPVLAGPNNANAPDIAALLFANGVAVQVNSSRELADTIVKLALDARRRHEMGTRGASIVADNRGALNKVLALVEPAINGVNRKA
jgi:3-deoxy-D-manno-octulosonic-acid transferase